MYFAYYVEKGTRQKKKVENSNPPLTESVKNFQKKKLKKALKALTGSLIKYLPLHGPNVQV